MVTPNKEKKKKKEKSKDSLVHHYEWRGERTGRGGGGEKISERRGKRR